MIRRYRRTACERLKARRASFCQLRRSRAKAEIAVPNLVIKSTKLLDKYLDEYPDQDLNKYLDQYLDKYLDEHLDEVPRRVLRRAFRRVSR